MAGEGAASKSPKALKSDMVTKSERAIEDGGWNARGCGPAPKLSWLAIEGAGLTRLATSLQAHRWPQQKSRWD